LNLRNPLGVNLISSEGMRLFLTLAYACLGSLHGDCLEKIHLISSNSWAKHGQKNEFEFNAEEDLLALKYIARSAGLAGNKSSTKDLPRCG